jgi:hypothetical protein
LAPASRNFQSMAIVRILLVSWLFVACARTQSGPSPSGPVARRAFAASGFGWRVFELPDRGIRLYLQRGTAAEADADVVADSVKRVQAEVLMMLGEPLHTPRQSNSAVPNASGVEDAALFFVGSRDDMRRLAGRPLAGFVQRGEATAFFLWARGYRAPIRHELAHLYTFERWGRPAAGDAATWLVEGIGAWVGGSCQGHSPDALAAGLLARDILPSAQQLAASFRSLPEDLALPTAGSLTKFLHSRESIAGLRKRWSARSSQALPDSMTLAAWRAHLRTVRPESLDVARVIREGC